MHYCPSDPFTQNLSSPLANDKKSHDDIVETETQYRQRNIKKCDRATASGISSPE